MEKEQQIQIGLRVPESVNEKLEKKALEIGISKNALILVLIDLGFQFYECNVNHQEE